MFIDRHLTYLKSIKEGTPSWTGGNAYKWAGYFKNPDALTTELDTTFSRESLFEYCSHSITCNEHAVLSVLAWGGMNRMSGKRLFTNPTHWIDTVNDLRLGKISTRYEAYHRFGLLRKQKQVPGLGVAYYTKLICFLKPELSGYILDQWTGKSINLLTGKKIIDISKGGWVKDTNDAKVYEEYCIHIEQIARHLDCSPIRAEEKLFSIGRGQGQWRNYVKQHYL
jgi:hypothetical protein